MTALHAEVFVAQARAGELDRTRSGYRFLYDRRTPPTLEIALAMPARVEAYDSPQLHPIFAMNLPEGYVLDRLRQRYAKLTPADPMLLLALIGSDEPIGRVRVRVEGQAVAPHTGESLAEILAYPGAEEVFRTLEQRYLQRSAVSGMQPKLLVPERMDAVPSPDDGPRSGPKAALLTRELIVKAAADDYPGLAINEFVCMSAARRAGMPVPDFHLSDNRALFVMRRFDRRADGTMIGFEDMATLTGGGTEQKYRGSYGQIARVIELYVPPEQRAPQLAQLFDIVALSCIVGNGDAHLKNFGLLYTDPATDDARLAPAYDIVNTTAYLPGDTLALGLLGSTDRSLFAARVDLPEFGRITCRLRDPRARIDALLAAVVDTLDAERDLLDEAPHVRDALRASIRPFVARPGRD